MIRARFLTAGSDYRPVTWPIAHPYWCTGYRDEAINALMDELAQGREVIPMSSHCGNPCAYASCKGFDYSQGGGCGGHVTGEQPNTEVKV